MHLTALGALMLLAGAAPAADVQHSDSQWRIENRCLRVTVAPETGAMTILDKRTNATWRQAEPVTCSTIIALKKAAGGTTIDGDLGEWGAAPTFRLTPDMTADARTVDGPDDLSADVWAAWDAEHLYLAARVRDDHLVLATAKDREWWEKDSAEFWVNGRQFGLALDPAAPTLFDMSHGGNPACGKSTSLVVKPAEGGYVLEGAFSWPALGLSAEEVGGGTGFRFAFGLNDADATGKREGQLYFPTTWAHSNPLTFATAQFADERGQVAAPVKPGPQLRNVREVPDGITYELVAAAGPAQAPPKATLTLPGNAADLVLETDLADRTQPVPTAGPMRPFVLDSPHACIAVPGYSDGFLVDCDDLTWRGQRWDTSGYLDMPWVGVTDMDKGYLLLADTPDDAAVSADVVDVAGKKRLAPSLVWENSKGQLRYPRRLMVSFFDHGGYVAICKRYRAYAKDRGCLVTQREKAKALPHLARLAGAPDVWGAWGVDFCRQAKAAGIDHMLVNWRGSKAEMEEIKSLGYLIGEYDNYVDIQEGPFGSAPNKAPIPAAAIKNADGSPSQGWVTWDKKTVYMQLCAALAVKDAQLLVPPLLKEHPFNARFLDVTTAMGLRECYDAEHPLTRTGWREANEALAKYVTGLGLVLGGEHGRWYGAKYYNYWEGMQSGGFYSWPAGHVGIEIPQKREDIGAMYLKYGLGHYYRVPLWELCFHDCVTSTWYWGDSTGHLYHAAPELADKQDAFNILYGTIPLYWVAQPYGFKWSDPVLRERLLQSYRDTCKLHEQVFYDEMLSHEFLTDDHTLQRTRFASGIETTVNFGEQPCDVKVGDQTYRLPQNGFVAAGGNTLCYQALDDNRKVTCITVPRYFFVDPAGKRHDFGVVESALPVTLRSTAPDVLMIGIGPGAPDSVTVRPARLTRDWTPKAARLFSLDANGKREASVSLARADEQVSWPAEPGSYELVWGAAANQPDLAVGPDSPTVALKRETSQASVTTPVRNLGLKATQALAVATINTISGPVELGRQSLAVAPGETKPAVISFPTTRLDGPWQVALTVAPDPPAAELLDNNNRATTSFVFPAAYERWQHRAGLSVLVEAVDRHDEVAQAPVDLAALFGTPADRLDPASLRVVELDAGGKLAQAVPCQLDPGGDLLFVLTGDTPAGAKRRFAVLCNEKAAAAPYRSGGEMTWDAGTMTVTTPTYRLGFKDGVISSCYSLKGGQPRESFLRSLGVSSQVTGWVDEMGEVTKTDVVTGPVRITVRVAKKLQGDVEYTKTYAFYLDYFTVTTDVNKPFGLYSRAYYLLPGQFEDDRGNKALVDGQGDAEDVAGKNPSPKWYAVYADGWAHSCIALTPFGGLTYWDGGAWGGIGFDTSETHGARLGYVVHPGEGDATFAIHDYDRLTHPPVVSVVAR